MPAKPPHRSGDGPRGRPSAVSVAAFLAGAASLLLAARPSAQSTLDAHWGHFALAMLPSLALFAIAAGMVTGAFRIGVLMTLLIGLAITALLHPVCIPITEQQRPNFESVKTLQERAAGGEPFCKIDGRWYQCKSYLARMLFF